MKKASVLFVFTILLICVVGCTSEGERVNDPAVSQFGEKEFSLQRPDHLSLDEMDEPLDHLARLDIKPGSCPNPLNPNSNGKLAVALLGSSTFDVSDVDVSSLLLEGVAPVKTRVEDVSGSAPGNEDCDCSTEGADGYDDLVLKFLTGDVSNALDKPVTGDVITLMLTGEMLDGSPFSAEDCIVVVGKPATLEFLPPESPNALMENFRAAYENMSLDGLREMLHPDFFTVLQMETIQEFPDVGITLDLNEELRIHDRMFSGLNVTDPAGSLVPGVQNISFQVFRALDTWQVSPPNDIFPNAEWAPYEVVILFDRGQEFSSLRVEGIIKFYVKSRELIYKGKTRRYYQMSGQIDLTNSGAKTEGISWGTAKALFR